MVKFGDVILPDPFQLYEKSNWPPLFITVLIEVLSLVFFPEIDINEQQAKQLLKVTHVNFCKQKVNEN